MVILGFSIIRRVPNTIVNRYVIVFTMFNLSVIQVICDNSRVNLSLCFRAFYVQYDGRENEI